MGELDRMAPELVSRRNRMNAYSGWSKEKDRAGRTARARAARQAKADAELARQIDPEGLLPPDELAARIRSYKGLDEARRDYERALAEAQQEKTVDPSAATGGPTSETTTTQSARTGQEPQ